MKLLFALFILSVTIHSAFCQCDRDTAKVCSVHFTQEFRFDDENSAAKCRLSQSMMSCLTKTNCLGETDEAFNVKKVRKMLDLFCGKEAIPHAAHSKAEHQTRRSLLSMWIGIVISFVILSK